MEPAAAPRRAHTSAHSVKAILRHPDVSLARGPPPLLGNYRCCSQPGAPEDHCVSDCVVLAVHLGATQQDAAVHHSSISSRGSSNETSPTAGGSVSG
ncbi:unnamed protein product [Lota lota]